jgi:hypothetical protein
MNSKQFGESATRPRLLTSLVCFGRVRPDGPIDATINRTRAFQDTGLVLSAAKRIRVSRDLVALRTASVGGNGGFACLRCSKGLSQGRVGGNGATQFQVDGDSIWEYFCCDRCQARSGHFARLINENVCVDACGISCSDVIFNADAS